MSTYEVRPRKVRDSAVRPPGSKSITNRALVTAALAEGRSRVADPLRSDDTDAMVGCLRRLGVEVETVACGFEVHSTGALGGGGRLDVRASGTTARFITAAATLADGPSLIDGTARMRERPIGPLVAALRALGAPVDAEGGGEFPPVRVAGGGLAGGRIAIDGSRSSQFVSAVLLSAPRAERTVTLDLGNDVVSRPYLETTMEVMAAFGAEPRWQDSRSITVPPTGYRATSLRRGGGCLGRGLPVGCRGHHRRHHHGNRDRPVQHPGRHAGAAGAGGDGVPGDQGPCGHRGDRTGPPRRGRSGPERLPGRRPRAGGGGGLRGRTPSLFTNIANLRIKETDRLAALENELTRLGARVTTGDDCIAISPGSLRPARIRTYDDHRMAMSFAVAGLVQPGIVIEDPGCVAKTWPAFFNMLETL